MTTDLAGAVSAAIGAPIVEARRTGGGDVNDAWRMTTATGLPLFVKHRGSAPEGLYRTEADGLRWLAEAGALPVPEVVAVLDGPEGTEPRALVLEWVEPGHPAPGADEVLGRGLAALHAAGAPCFGLASDNFIGPLRQVNDPCDTWAELYATRRVEPLARRAVDRGLLDPRVGRAVERLAGRMADLVGPVEPPARLHGDLWRGNVHHGADGVARLVDPAVYGGHREVDLAMMRLFGGFGARCFAAYAKAAPLAAGHEDRVALHQLYPLLVHVLLFGGGYVASFEEALARYVPLR